MEELTSFQDWLRQMVDGEAITEVEDCYACQASQGVKTAKIVNGDVAITVVLKLSKLKKIVRNSTFVRIKQMLTNMPCSLFFQELGTLLNSLKEGVKTVTAITKYGMVIGEEYALGD